MELISSISYSELSIFDFWVIELTKMKGTKIPCVFLSFSKSEVSVLIIPVSLTVSPVITFPTLFYLSSHIIWRGVLS